MANYIKKEELLIELLLSKENNELTDNAVKMILKMITECTRTLRYKEPEDKKDCMSEAMYDVLKYWRNFDPNHPKSNVFSFFTQVIKNGLAKGWKKVKPIKSIDVISISISNGIHNI